MKAHSLVVGTKVRFEGQAYVVDHSGPRGIALRAADPNAVRTLTVSELTDACKRNELEVQDLFSEQASEATPVPRGLAETVRLARLGLGEPRQVRSWRRLHARSPAPTGHRGVRPDSRTR